MADWATGAELLEPEQRWQGPQSGTDMAFISHGARRMTLRAISRTNRIRINRMILDGSFDHFDYLVKILRIIIRNLDHYFDIIKSSLKHYYIIL